MSSEETRKRTAAAGHAIAWRVAFAVCVLMMAVLGVLAGQRYFAPGDSNAVDRIASQERTAATSADGSSAGASVETGGASPGCGSCDARHRHIIQLREANP